MNRHRHDQRTCEVYQDISFEDTVITVVGVPGVITFVLEALVRDGCNIRIIDNTVVGPCDLHNTTLFTPSHVGKPRSECAKAALKRLNKAAIVKGFYEDVTDSTSYLLSGIVINASFSKAVAEVCPDNTVHITPEYSVSQTFQNGQPTTDWFIGDLLQRAGDIINTVYEEVKHV